MVLHRATGHTYPHVTGPPSAPAAPSGLHATDIDAALEDTHETFDISRDDLDMLLTHAERHAATRAGK